MKYSVLSITFAVALAATATAALADPTEVASAPNQNLARQQATENEAMKAYSNGVNQLWAVHTTGPYDQEDAFKGANGFMLPGTSNMGGANPEPNG